MKATEARWQFAVEEADVEPVGSIESLQSAIAGLGPFKHELQKEAEKFGPWDALGGRLALSKELAFERVWMLAAAFNRHSKLEETAPRSKAVIDQLRAIEVKTGELARLFASLDDVTRHRLRTGGTGISYSAELLDPVVDGADIEGLPGPAGWDDAGHRPRWIARLESLSCYVNHVEKMFLVSKGIENPDVPDKGGNRNLYKDLHGSARWALAHEGWHIYELFKPEEASGTEGGPFHRFLMHVFEYATGLDPEEHSKLMHAVKTVCKANRQYSDVSKEIRLLDAEAKKFRRSPSERPQKYFETFGRRRLELEKRRQDLFRAVYPHNFRGSRPGE